MYEMIDYELNDGICHITINRPQSLNALNNIVLDELHRAFLCFASDDDAKVAIVTGTGKAFVAGADIAQMRQMTAIEGRALMKKGHDVVNLMEFIEKPIIAAINGFALGGGCELAMACDFRIASESARFGQPEVNLGIIPGIGGTQRLSRLVGKGMAKYMIMTGEMIGADEAFRIGLVEKVVAADQLIETAEKLARTLMQKAPIALASAKMAINNGYNLDIRSACAYELEAFVKPFASEDRIEGMESFLEKRSSSFQNR